MEETYHGGGKEVGSCISATVIQQSRSNSVSTKFYSLVPGDLVIAKQIKQSSDESQMLILTKLCKRGCSTYFEREQVAERVHLLVSGQKLETLKIAARTFYAYEKLAQQAHRIPQTTVTAIMHNVQQST